VYFVFLYVCSVGIATRCGLDGPGIESSFGEKFFASVQTGPGAHPASCAFGTGSFPGLRRPSPGGDHLPFYSFEVKGVELYLYSASGLSRQVLRWYFPFVVVSMFNVCPVKL
jgi:hypothetical protein